MVRKKLFLISEVNVLNEALDFFYGSEENCLDEVRKGWVSFKNIFWGFIFI